MGRATQAFLFIISSLTLSFFQTASAGTLLRLNSGTFDASRLSPLSMNSLDSAPQATAVTEYILQFSRPIRPADKILLKKQFQVFGYLPDDALVVRGSWRGLQAYRSHYSGVRAIVPYEAKFKVSSQLPVLSVFNKEAPLSVIVTVFSPAESSKLARTIQRLNPQVELQDIHGRRLQLLIPRGLIPQIANLTGVEHVAPTPVMELFDANSSEATPDEYSQLTGFEDGTRVMKLSAAWEQGFTGSGQTLAMADTGVDSGDLANIIPDLQGALLAGQAYGLRSASWADPMGHGTHVAGLMVGRGTASGERLHGAAIGAQLIAQGMWSPVVRNMTVPSKLSVLFDGAYQAGARVHSNSWGSNRDLGAYDDSAVQVDEWTSQNPDMLVVFAAGNSGGDLNKDGRIDSLSLGSPGTAKNCLTVGASKNRISQGGVQGPIGRLREGVTLWSVEPLASSSMSDNEQGLAPFSARGPTKDGRLKPDIVAPGTNILGTKSHQSGASSLWGFFNRDYTWSGGTSMAAPLAAGAAGVARQILIEKWGVQNPSAALVKASLLHSAEDLFPGQFGEVGAERGQELLTRRPNFDEGYGRVNMENLVRLAAGTQIIDNREGLAQDQSVSYKIVVPEGAGLYVNLVWTDAPGSANAAVALVNDLDMQLTFPDGRVWVSQDHVNNQESLELSGLMPGIYELTIKGSRVPSGPQGAQPYALIYSVRIP